MNRKPGSVTQYAHISGSSVILVKYFCFWKSFPAIMTGACYRVLDFNDNTLIKQQVRSLQQQFEFQYTHRLILLKLGHNPGHPVLDHHILGEYACSLNQCSIVSLVFLSDIHRICRGTPPTMMWLKWVNVN